MEQVGLVFGKDGNKYISKPITTDGHTLILGGSGTGKSSGVVIPSILSWESSIFTIDVKGELYNITKAARGDAKIKVFDPKDSSACGYDPYEALRNTDDLPGEAKSLAMSICPVSIKANDPIWGKSAQELLTGFILFYFNQGLNFSETMLMIADKKDIADKEGIEGKKAPNEIPNHLKTIIAQIMASDNRKARIYVNPFHGMADETLFSVFMELSSHITEFAANDYLQRALSGKGKCISPLDLEKGYDIYYRVPQHYLEQWQDLTVMICNQFIKAFERRPEGKKNCPILFLLDEFPTLGKIERINGALSTLRSKNIHIALCIQSKSQLDSVYGKDITNVVMDNCTYKVILKATEPETQKWCSELLGTFEELKRSTSTNTGFTGFVKGHSSSQSLGAHEPIIQPAAFGYLQNEVICHFPNGYLKLDKIEYWKDKKLISKINTSFN